MDWNCEHAVRPCYDPCIDRYGFGRSVCGSNFFIISTHKSSSYAVGDASLEHALKQRPFGTHAEPSRPDTVLSYDMVCGYGVNIPNRAKNRSHYLGTLLIALATMRFVIPALHIVNHIAKCMYVFGTNFLAMLGHFYGETAEHYWPELNQLGSFTKQMNAGHRHNTIINHHNDWNFKKMINLGS